MKLIDLTGRIFGRWHVLCRGENFGGRPGWACACDCGAVRTVRGADLRSGKSVSCGCYFRECVKHRFVTHGKSRTTEHRIWQNLKDRCLNPKNPAYKNYGGRGISVCKRWMKFENFYADMGARPKGLTLERINNDDGYKPSNCCWATRKAQSINRRCVYNKGLKK